ncbi:MAG: type II toxin-antitoxin system RelE/ParE family toxin [Polaribacter sp.]
MKYKIVWSNFAEFQLDLLFNYYAEEVNIKLAKKIIFQIRDGVKQLKKSPFIGQKEELLAIKPKNISSINLYID